MCKNLIISVALISVFAMLLLSSGCGRMSEQNHFDKNPQIIRVYGGTRFDLDVVSGRNHCLAGCPMFLVDLPFSFALDTILLPFDLIHMFQVLDDRKKRGQ